MTISALLITLDDRSVPPERTVHRLAQFESLTLGDRRGLLLPAVLDTDGPRRDRQTIALLNDLPGVAKVDVLSIFFDEAIEP